MGESGNDDANDDANDDDDIMMMMLMLIMLTGCGVSAGGVRRPHPDWVSLHPLHAAAQPLEIKQVAPQRIQSVHIPGGLHQGQINRCRMK